MIEEIMVGESKNIEFIERRPNKYIRYMKTVIAFANSSSDGGKLIFGIHDKTREVVGIEQDIVFKEMDAITNAISDSCEPTIIPDIYLQTIENKTIIVVEIPAGRKRPYYIKSEGIMDGVYIRVAGTTRPADRETIKELYYESEGRSYDSMIRKDLTVTDKEIEKLCLDMKKVALSNCQDEYQRQSLKDVTKNVLLNWGILAETKDGSIHPTNAYLLLTGQDVFYSKIQCGMFKGKTRAIFLDKREFEGTLWEQVELAFKFVLRNIRLGAKFEGVYRKDVYELPPNSIRELIINAVMNCSNLKSSHVQIAIYDDRLEITSPGGLMPGVTIERMKEGYSQIRNRALAYAFSYMNLIEGWGTGIPRLLQEMKEYDLPEPEFIDMEIALRINLYRKNAEFYDRVPESAGKCRESTVKMPESIEKVPERESRIPKSAGNYIKVELTVQQQLIYKRIIETGAVTTAEVENLLGVKQRRARAILKEMIDKNIITRIGASKNTRYIFKKSDF